MASTPFDQPAAARDYRSLLAGRIPAVQRELVETLSASEFDPFRVECLIGYDPILCAQVLRSARELRPQEVITDLWTAVVQLGAESLREIAHCSAPTGGQWNWNAGWRDSGGLLEQSLSTAVAARTAMRSRDPSFCSQAYTAALIANIGEFLMLHEHGREWIELRARQRNQFGRVNLEEERARFGTDSRQACEDLLLAWCMPPRIIDLLTGTAEDEVSETVADAKKIVAEVAFHESSTVDASSDPERRLRDEMWSGAMDHLRGFGRLLGTEYRGLGDLGRLLELAEEPPEPARPVSLRTVGEQLTAMDSLDSETELVRWIRRSVLERTRFERARAAVLDDTGELYIELVGVSGGPCRPPREIERAEVEALLGSDRRASARIEGGIPLPGLDEGVVCSPRDDRILIPLGLDHEGRAIGLLFLDRPFSGRAPLRQDLELVELFARAAGARIESQRLRQALEVYRTEAERDFLTGIYNRRSTMRLLEREMARARRTESPLAMAMLDIDNFKNFNDTYGHLAGDAVLREVARVLNETARESDVVGRFGGEEFLIVLPDAPIEAAYMFAERLRSVVENFGKQKIHQYPDNPPTISIGVSWVVPERDTAEDAIARVDKALYGSKRAGRNRVCLEPAEPTH